MDLETVIQWNKSEREKQISYNIAYMWNLEKWYTWTYLQSRNRDISIENKLWIPREAGEAGWIRKLGVTYIHIMCVLSHFNHVQLFETLWTVALQAPLSMGFSRLEYWSGLPCPPPGDLSDPGIEPESPASAGGFFATSATWEALDTHCYVQNGLPR